MNSQGVKIVFGILAGLVFVHWYLWSQWRSGRLAEGWRVWQRAIHGLRAPWSHWKDEDRQMATLHAQVQRLRAPQDAQGEAHHE